MKGNDGENMDLLIATNNQGKASEFKKLLASQFDNIYSLADIGKEIEVEETGITFQQNAKKKAIEVAKATGMVTLGDDSGLVVDALYGAPGVFSARYSKQRTDESNIAKLLTNMADVPEEKRTARFVCALALCNPEDLSTVMVTGTCEGMITEKPVGNKGFGYDPVFYYPQSDMTFAQMTDEEKNSISHRFNAVAKLCKILDNSKVKQTSLWD